MATYRDPEAIDVRDLPPTAETIRRVEARLAALHEQTHAIEVRLGQTRDSEREGGLRADADYLEWRARAKHALAMKRGEYRALKAWAKAGRETLTRRARALPEADDPDVLLVQAVFALRELIRLHGDAPAPVREALALLRAYLGRRGYAEHVLASE